MKPLLLTPVKMMTRCDLYLCGDMAKHQIAVPDSPPGQCFRVCDAHMESLVHLLTHVKLDAPSHKQSKTKGEAKIESSENA